MRNGVLVYENKNRWQLLPDKAAGGKKKKKWLRETDMSDDQCNLSFFPAEPIAYLMNL